MVHQYATDSPERDSSDFDFIIFLSPRQFGCSTKTRESNLPYYFTHCCMWIIYIYIYAVWFISIYLIHNLKYPH